MTLRNTKESYGAVARMLHWLIALAIFTMIAVGLTMSDMPRGPEKNELLRLHASGGLTVLFLMTLRLLWRLVNPVPAPPEGTPRWQALAATFAHWGLYLLVYAQVATGVMTLFTVAWNIPFFGLFEIPTPYAERDMDAHHLWEERHIFFFWTIVAVLSVHAAAALYHHFLKKDNALRRMTLG
ncbi:MAG: cytochrome b [Rhodomicrobium sp.]|nr:cytochrome b [Rhodomicrobium sp.]